MEIEAKEEKRGVAHLLHTVAKRKSFTTHSKFMTLKTFVFNLNRFELKWKNIMPERFSLRYSTHAKN